MHRRGFSLLELSVVLLISGLMLSFVLQLGKTNTNADCVFSNKNQIFVIRGAIERFARTNDRLPLPAARNIGVEDINYGRESTAAQITAGAIDQVAGVSLGAVPFQALGLAPSYAGDCWGNKFSYAVTTALTTNSSSGGYLDSAVLGNITVKSSLSPSIVFNSATAYAVFSHGEDGLGAVKINYSGAGHGWCTGASTLLTMNCLATGATLVSATFIILPIKNGAW